jgi:hypothetical protein
MASFNPHTGIQGMGYTALPKTTFSGVLDSIVTDVGAGYNGWSVYDDQRTNSSTYYMPVDMRGWNWYPQMNYNCFSASNGSAIVKPIDTHESMKCYRAFTAGMPISFDTGTNWYNVSGVLSNTSMSLDRVFTETSYAFKRYGIVTKAQGYVVLQCSNTQRTFYVQITKQPSTACPIWIQTWESWNSTTHSGTNGSPIEQFRAYDTASLHTTGSGLQYITWFLPGALGLWMGADPASAVTSTEALWHDFCYIGNLTPYAAGDTDCLIMAHSNTSFSGMYTYYNARPTSASIGAACVLRSRYYGLTWKDPSRAIAAGGMESTCLLALRPKGQHYLTNIDLPPLSMDGRVQITSFEAWPG